MHLYAISDLHLGHASNLEALDGLSSYPDDWLIVAGDIGETDLLIRVGFSLLTQKFARVFWTPGNHDLWTMPSDNGGVRGVAKYEHLVSIAREYGVTTPEDEYVLWPGAGAPLLIAPIFVGYDYSFRPDEIAAHEVLNWAADDDVLCADEALLHPDPYVSRSQWCADRVRLTEARLDAASEVAPLILANHYPLRQEHAQLRRIPRFSPWCGTRLTTDWHTKYSVHTVIYGHLHIRTRRMVGQVPFHEVSLGYPKQWDPSKSIDQYLRQILPQTNE